MLDRVLVQEPEDVARWEAIGVRPGRVQVTGRIKFDQSGQAASSPEQVAAFRALLQQVFGGTLPQVVLAASTHPGEEEAPARLWSGIRQDFPGVRLLLAAGGIRQTTGLKELARLLPVFLEHPAAARKMASQGKAALARHAGATQRTAAVLGLNGGAVPL